MADDTPRPGRGPAPDHGPGPQEEHEGSVRPAPREAHGGSDARERAAGSGQGSGSGQGAAPGGAADGRDGNDAAKVPELRASRREGSGRRRRNLPVPVTATPIQPAGPETTHHWDARAESVSEIESELARIWGLAAREASLEGMTPSAEADAYGDPRFAPRIDQSRDIRVRARTSVLTLVVVATRPETLERTLDVIAELAGRHPSRAIILAPGDPDGPPALDARISLECMVRPASVAETCAERILMMASGETAQHLAGLATPLLIHDLPVVLWWADDPPLGSRQLRELTETCDQLLIDSGAFRDDGATRLAALAVLVSGGQVAVHDVGWMRLTLWRELLGGLFDHPLLLPELPSLRSVRLNVLRPGATLRLSKAALFAGWLASALDLDVAHPLEPKRNSESLVGVWTDGHREIRVEFRPVPSVGQVASVANGSLQRVELELGRGRRQIRARVSRNADHLLATADWDGAEVARRAGRLEPFDEGPYVAESLNKLGHDRIFEESVARAARLVSGHAS